MKKKKKMVWSSKPHNNYNIHTVNTDTVYASKEYLCKVKTLLSIEKYTSSERISKLLDEVIKNHYSLALDYYTDIIIRIILI